MYCDCTYLIASGLVSILFVLRSPCTRFHLPFPADSKAEPGAASPQREQPESDCQKRLTIWSSVISRLTNRTLRPRVAAVMAVSIIHHVLPALGGARNDTSSPRQSGPPTNLFIPPLRENSSSSSFWNACWIGATSVSSEMDRECTSSGFTYSAMSRCAASMLPVPALPLRLSASLSMLLRWKNSVATSSAYLTLVGFQLMEQFLRNAPTISLSLSFSSDFLAM